MPACKIVRCPHATEQPIDQCQGRRLSRDIAARLRKNHDQRILSQEGGFAAHIGAGDQPEPVFGTQTAIVGDKGLPFLPQRVLDHRMSAAMISRHGSPPS